MAIIEKSDVKGLLSQKEIISGVVKQALNDPGIVDNLTDEVADKIYEELENDYDFKKRVMRKALSTQIFKDRLMKKLK